MSRDIAKVTADTLIPAYGKEDLYSTPITTLFASTNNAVPTNTATGFIAALQQSAQAYSTPPENNRILYPVIWNNYLNIKRPQIILLKSATFYAIDSLVTGGSGADPAVIADIETSLNDPRGAYSSSRFANGILPTNAVNLFRPKISYNQSNILFDASQTFSSNNATSPSAIADKTIGLALPYTINFNVFLSLPINSIEITAQCGQYITSQSKWQMYPLFCEITFGVRDSSLPPPPKQPTTTTTR